MNSPLFLPCLFLQFNSTGNRDTQRLRKGKVPFQNMIKVETEYPAAFPFPLGGSHFAGFLTIANKFKMYKFEILWLWTPDFIQTAALGGQTSDITYITSTLIKNSILSQEILAMINTHYLCKRNSGKAGDPPFINTSRSILFVQNKTDKSSVFAVFSDVMGKFLTLQHTKSPCFHTE